MRRIRMFAIVLCSSAVLSTAAARANMSAPPPAARPAPEASSLEHSFVFGGLLLSLQGNDLACVGVTSPGTVKSVYRSGAYIRRIDERDRHVFVANDSAGVKVLSYADPARPKLEAQLPMSPGFKAMYVKLIGRRAFVVETSESAANLRIYDASTPATPALKQVLPLGGGSRGPIVAVGAAHLAVATGADVKIVYVGYPSAFIRSSLAAPAANGLVSKGTLVALSRGCGRFGCGFSFVETWDVSQPAQPKMLKRFTLQGWYSYDVNNLSLAQIGNRLCLLSGVTDGAEREALAVLEITAPASPKLLSVTNLSNAPHWYLIPGDIDAFGTSAIVWGWPPPHFPPGYQYYVTRVDLRDPAKPKMGAFTNIPPK